MQSETLRKTAAVTAAVVILLSAAGSLFAQVGTRVGNFMYKGNPQLLNGRTIDVSDSMVALSSVFWSETSRDTTITNGETPAIMFMIDNSGSMTGRGGTDSNGYRFLITRRFIDTIWAKYKNAKVGLSIFGTHLWFDPNDTNAVTRYPFMSKFPLTQCLPQFQHDDAPTGAYIPLLQLDSVYANYGGLTGRQLLDTMLFTTGTAPNVTLSYSPTNAALRGNPQYTNITAAFDAVKSAMASTTTSRCSQYAIFLSDGVGNRPDGTYNGDVGVPRLRSRYFVDSTQNVPTTFTVFFPASATLGNTLGLREIDTMTFGRRAPGTPPPWGITRNGYDPSHPTIGDTAGCTGRSFYTAGNPATLWSNFQTMWDIIRLPNRVSPTLVVVNGSTSFTRVPGDTGFQFTNFIPLLRDTTPVSVQLVYSIYQNNKKVGDTILYINYNVHTQPHATPVWHPSQADSFDVWTWDRDHVFLYNSAVIPAIQETMDSVELYFTFDSGTAKYGYDNVYIDLYNKIAPIDSLNIQLSRVSDRVFSGKFKRQVSATANRFDALLQYRGTTDSIIAVFRNRENLTTGKVRLPLDTLRKAIGFTGGNLIIAPLADTTITAGDTTLPMRPTVTYSSTGGAVPDTWVVKRLTWTELPTVRNFDQIIATTNQYSRFTARVMDTLVPRQIQITLTLPNGSTVIAIKNIRVRHAVAYRLWIEADNTPDPYVTNPFGTMVFSGTTTQDSAWAVLRDKFSNLVGFSTTTQWLSRDTSVVTVANGNQPTGEGVVIKGPLVDTATWVRARNNTDTTLRDSIRVVITSIVYDRIRIMSYVGSTLTQIYDLYDTIPDSATIYVQAHRLDGLGGNGGWMNVAGTWSLLDGVAGKTSTFPPTSSNSWSFTPIDTGTGRISVSLTGFLGTAELDPVVFSVGTPNLMYIYPHGTTPNVTGNMAWPAPPATADTMSADSIYSLLYTKLFYRMPSGKEIWIPRYDSIPLSDQITWSANGARDTMSPTYGSHSNLRSRESRRVSTVTARWNSLRWNSLSYSMNIYVTPGLPDHLVIEATAAVQNLIADDPLATLIIPSSDTSGFAYAHIRDHWGNYRFPSVNSLWSSTNTAIFIARKGDTATGQGIAIRRANNGSALMIATDAVARPGFTMRDTVPVVLNDVYYDAVRIYVNDPLYNPYIVTDSIPVDSTGTFYAEGRRSDDSTRWEQVAVRWSKDASLITAVNPPGTPVISWTVVPGYVSAGRIRVNFDQPAQPTLSDSVWVIFTEGVPASVALYRTLGTPVSTAPVFPATDTVAAGSIDSVFAKIFDSKGAWLNRFETDVALAQATISWSIQRIADLGGTADTLSVRTGRRTTFSPQTAYSLYRVTATFTQGGLSFTASAQIYVRPGAPDHIVIEPTVPVTQLVSDNPLAQVTLGQHDTTYDKLYAVIRDRFGNFYDYSHNPDWWSVSNTIVTADRGTAWQQYGQGEVNRVTPDTATTWVMARDLDYPSLRFDSVYVVLATVPYDSLRITLRDPVTGQDTVRIPGSPPTYTMQSGTSQTFYVQAHRALGDRWENVTANFWQYVATLGSRNFPAGHGVDFPAIDTAHGMMTATYGSFSAWINIVITAGNANSLVLYKYDRYPGVNGNDPKPNPPQFVTVAAASRDTAAALVFDSRGVFLPQFLIGAERLTIGWTAVSRSFNDNLGNRLMNISDTNVTAVGPAVRFAPTRAYDTVLVIASLGATMHDTMLVVVIPGPGDHIVLENTPNYDRYLPDPCDTLTILDNQQSGSVYAILRDQYENVVSPAYAALIRDSVWSLHDSISVNIPAGNRGELQALRLGLSDTGKIYAWDSHGYRDSCVVRLIAYRYLALRIVSAPNTPYAPGYTLTMTNNDSVQIYVEGQRSDDMSWVSVPAFWEIQPSLQPALPGNNRYSRSFMVSPTDTGSGWIRVSLGALDMGAVPDTLALHFTPGPGVRATLTIITPPSQRIAGELLTAVDSLFDADNHLIRSLPPVTAAYHDTIGRGGLLRPEPQAWVWDGTAFVGLMLDSSPWDAHSQIFAGGVSTVVFRLYYAPAAPVPADSMHQIFGNLTIGNTTYPVHTEPFVLLPAPLSSIGLERNNQPIPSGTTITLSYNSPESSSVNIFSRGFDQYHNDRGYVPTDWSVNNPFDSLNHSLHLIAYQGGDSVTNINYSTSDPTFSGADEAGWITAQVPGNPAINNSVFVVIFGPLITLDSAVTGDWSGNGLLDHMTLYFDRPFTPTGSSFNGLRIFNGSSVYFDTLSYTILNNTGSPSAVWVVSFNEHSTGTPQTGWTPTVRIGRQQNSDGRDIVVETTLTSLDGAGPVIWSVVNHRYSNLANDRSKDTVTVTFSEPVLKNTGFIKLPQTDPPANIFYVWTDSMATDTVPDNDKLVGINTQYNEITNNNTVVTFLMLDSADLNGHNFLNIRDSGNMYVVDMRHNQPNDNNQLVQVVVIGKKSPPLVVPNPAIPYVGNDHQGPGEFSPDDLGEEAIRMTGPGGIAVIIEFPVPEPGVTMDCQVKIYDMVGNVVQWGRQYGGDRFDPTHDFLSTIKGYRNQAAEQGLITAYFYWNCTNRAGMAVAPGVYRMVIYLHYDVPATGVNRTYKDERQVCKIGIKNH